jgi:hypothetical protein
MLVTVIVEVPDECDVKVNEEGSAVKLKLGTMTVRVSVWVVAAAVDVNVTV